MNAIRNNPIIKMISKILSWVILAILFLIAAFLMYYVISSKMYEARGVKFEPKMSLYTIISTSMEPNIKVYDVVVDWKVKPENIKKGDVITFISSSTLSEGMTVTHRVLDIVETEAGLKFRVKGDNNSTPDSSLVDANNILGKVLFKLPQVGRLQFLLQSKGGWLFVLLIPALCVVIYDIIKVVRLSSVKEKIEEVTKEPVEDLELKKKEEELKKRLKKKFVGVIPVEPMIQTVEEEDNVEEPIVNKKTTKVKKKEKVVKNEDITITEKTIYENELKTIKKSNSKNKDKVADDDLLEEILANSKRRRISNNNGKKKKSSDINKKLDDYDINLDMKDIYDNIKKLNQDDDFPVNKK